MRRDALQRYSRQSVSNCRSCNFDTTFPSLFDVRRGYAHWGMSGVERADGLVKDCAQGDQAVNDVRFCEKRSIVSGASMKPPIENDDSHRQSREQ